MALATILDPPQNVPDFAVWSFAHAAHHRDINRVVFSQSGTQLPDFVLDPWDPTDSETWLYQHQLMHTAQNQVLGIAGYNLTTLEWDAPAQVLDWFWSHGQEHYQAGAILNLG